MADGAFGALIVRESNDVNSKAYNYDLSQHVIVLSDWFNETFIEKYTDYTHGNGNQPYSLTNKSTLYTPTSTSILINGRGVYQKYNSSTSKTYSTLRTVFQVQRGYRYRFRAINVGVTNCPIQLAIQNHTLSVIAVDGQPIVPYTVDILNINPGID
jgi:L-ascorbate oxidase